MHASNFTPKFGSSNAMSGRLNFVPKKPRIVLDDVQIELAVRDRRIDAEAAGVGTAEARERRHHLDRPRLVQRRFDERPALAHAGEDPRRLARRQVQSEWTLGHTILEHLVDEGAIGKAEDEVEIALGVLRERARMRPSERGHRAARPEELAQRVRKLRRSVNPLMNTRSTSAGSSSARFSSPV